MRRTATMAPSGSSGWQRFAYAWDEVGRLMSASRWDLASSRDYAVEHDVSSRLENPPPSRTADAKMAYVYDGADERVVKTTTDRNNVARHTVDVFANYKLRLTTEAATAAGSDYTLDGTTERVELQSHGVTVGRVETMATSASTLATPGQRVLLVLHDALGSAGIVLDRETGELAEAVTYTAYGQTESDLRPERFGSNREDERFTGKEEDVEVGLVYFGKRYLVPAMARWASADPLAVHAPGEADLNLYAYVHGRVYVAVDLEGLADVKVEGANAVAVSDDGGTLTFLAGDDYQQVQSMKTAKALGTASRDGGVGPSEALAGDVTVLGASGARDAATRPGYQRADAALGARARREFASSTVRGGAEEGARSLRASSSERNGLRAASQRGLSTPGEAISKTLEGLRSWDDIVAKYGDPAVNSDAAERILIGVSSSRANVNVASRILASAGTALGVAGIALSVRDVVSAPPDQRMGVARQVGASMLGGWAGAQGAAFLFLGAGSVTAAAPVVLVTIAACSVVGSMAGWEAAR